MEHELKELKEFVAEIKADRVAQKEKEKRESWTKYTSLTIVILAVLSAIAAQWAGKFSGRVLVNLNDSTFHQTKASDQWSFYQAKSIKQNLYEIERDRLKNDAHADPKVMEKIEAKIQKYDKEKADVMAEAKKLEELREKARDVATTASHQGGEMGLSISLFSISIAMGSICLVVKKRWLWYVAIFLGTAATLQAIKAIWFVS